MTADKSEFLQGTLDLMVLKTLHALGPQHGFGIARRIEHISEQVLKLNEGTVYTSLLRFSSKAGPIPIWVYQRTTGRLSSTRSQSAGSNSLRLRRQAGKQYPAQSGASCAWRVSNSDDIPSSSIHIQTPWTDRSR
jgi:PadR family transcriptional regulator, regulatory protein PadR